MINSKKGVIVLEDEARVEFELFPEHAPITVENFVKLVNSGFYNGLTFHRVIPGFVIQGGCPVGNGTGGPGYTIKGEFDANGVKNPLKHNKGVLSMARANHPDSAGSQFFIMIGDVTHLDGQYAAFGQVTSNFEKCLEIANVESNHQDKPLKPVIIKRIELV